MRSAKELADEIKLPCTCPPGACLTRAVIIGVILAAQSDAIAEGRRQMADAVAIRTRCVCDGEQFHVCNCSCESIRAFVAKHGGAQ